MNGDVSLMIQRFVKLEIIRIQRPDNWRQSPFDRNTSLIPGVPVGSILNFRIARSQQLCQVFMLPRGGCAPIDLSGAVSEIESQIGKPSSLTEPLDEPIRPVRARTPVNQVSYAIDRT